ncbi:arsenite methyltransferase isoform X3 [Camelus bactrianus]|uniref:Arsenite methyltransferase isoform X3 n=1 Tax=Camelus bactrianus TaxID=9837 RepID=A0AC58R5L7_CAMBA
MTLSPAGPEHQVQTGDRTAPSVALRRRLGPDPAGRGRPAQRRGSGLPAPGRGLGSTGLAAAGDPSPRVRRPRRRQYYGCGLVIPECLENCWILDLGSGSGRDCYALSQLVGEKGHVTGIDMTEGQVEVAKKYMNYHMEKYGFRAPNVTFIYGYIEKLGEAGIKNESYDIVISNCVINLVPDKQRVLQEVYRVLKHGGELYFSDVYASLELPEEIRTHKILWGDCRFVSATFRLFKLPMTGPTERCQVTYNGGITGHEKGLVFDANFTFKKGETVEVDEETAAILKNSRFAQDFLIRPIGEKLPTRGGCTALQAKDIITDPFQLAEESDHMKSRCPPDAAGGCCDTKKCCKNYN